MRLDHPQLEARLEQVLGANVSHNLPELSVLGLQLHGTSASIELRMSFKEGSIPPNFQKKSRNCLILFLDIPDFELEITKLGSHAYDYSIDIIKSDQLTLNIGKYQYHFVSTVVQFGRMQSVNEMDLVESEL